jgi:RHS repeat-associated protein
MHDWQTVYGDNGTTLITEITNLYSTGGARYATNIAPDRSYTVTTYSYARRQSVTRYDSSSNQLSSINYSYDPHSRLASAADARNGTNTYVFNNADQVVTNTTPVPGPGLTPEITTTTYDSSLRPVQITQPDATVVTNQYNLMGLVVTNSGSRTYPVGYTFDGQARMRTMTTWTSFGTQSGAATTTWNYDTNRGWLASKRYADGNGPAYTYTPAGRLKTRSWARGVTTTYSYNAAGDLASVTYSDTTPGVTYTYDRRGRQATLVQNGISTTFAYNNANLVLSESYSGGTLSGLTITNGYDQLLRRTNLVVQQSNNPLIQQSFTYDAASRLHAVTDRTNSATYSYLVNSPLVSQIFFTNSGAWRMTTTKQYDLLNRLTSISSSSSFSYLYNPANQRTAVTNADNSYWLYQYDALGQVVSGRKFWSDGTPVAGQQFVYNFDDIGNRQSAGSGGDQFGANLRYQNYSANNLNQYTQRTVPGYPNVIGTAKSNASVTLWGSDGSYTLASRHGDYFRGELAVNNSTGALWLTITNFAVLTNGSNPDIETNLNGSTFLPKTPEVYGYDLDGNLTNDGRWTYTWDAENRLVGMQTLGSIPAAARLSLVFAYDWQGRRISKTVSNWVSSAWQFAGQTNFTYDGWNLVAELNALNPSTLVRSYLWGLDLSGSPQGAGGVGGLLAVAYYGAQTTNSFVTFDGNGNVAALVNAADGTALAQYEYGPFGEVVRATGPMAKLNPFRFSTKYQDDESDLIMYPVRPYSPSTGRWLSRDALEEAGGLNLYLFAGNDPVQFIDPFGYEWKVVRARADRALATCDCKDTVAQLAAKIHLDPADYRRWLQATGNSQLPASADTPLPQGATFTIPNKTYVNDLLAWRFMWWKQWRRVEERDLRHEGFEVIHVDDTLRAQFLAQMSDPDVHGIVVLAHGDPDRKGDFSDAGPDYVTPDEAAGVLHHKLGGFKAIWCWSGVKENGWRGLVSPTGYLWSYPGYIFIYDSWPGFIQHGFPDN